MNEPTGPDRVRAAIERSRGGQAPPHPVNLCGTPDPDALRADDPRWSGATPPEFSISAHLWAAIGDVLICPGCLGLRFGFGHLVRKILIGAH